MQVFFKFVILITVAKICGYYNGKERKIMTESKLRKSPAWEELTFANNFMFCKIMESEPEICRRLLEILLHIEIEKLEMPHYEHTMQETPDAKSVRFDVYTKDEKRIFDLEIQTTNNPNLPKRARYYQSVIDIDNLSRGENYGKLKDSYVIFLCLDDPFGKGLPVYSFENKCPDNDGGEIKLNDGTYKLFFNAAEYGKIKDDEEKAFFKFLVEQNAESDFTKSIEEKVSFARKNMTWRKMYMTWQQTIDEEKGIAFEEGKAEGFEQGIERGAEQKAIESAENFLRKGLPAETISECIGLPLEQVRQIAESIKNAF